MTRPAAASHDTHDPSPAVRRRPAPPTPLSVDGVQDITRKVIRQLEGLGHDGTDDMAHEENEDSDLAEVESTIVSGNSTRRSSVSNGTGHPLNNGHANGSGGIENSKRPAAEKPVDYEIPRKLLHSSIGFLTFYLYAGEGDPRKVVVALWSALCIIYPADVLRFRSRRFAKLYESLLGFLMRDEEKNRVNGVIWYILGVNFVLSCLPLDVATVSVLILSWADTAASTFGRMYGRRTPKLPPRILGLPLAPRKSTAGFIAASVTGAAIAMGFWGALAGTRHGGADAIWKWEGGVRGAGGGGVLGLLAIGVVAGLVSGVAEALDLGNLDDNLTLPIISGSCLFGFFKLWEYGAASLTSWFS
ncbi:hypothetical protein DFP72DRAFT_1095286 [Ephemerocybe angulata]|uniref:Phosphatidate cytidylyltransferase n=1 Tax=Ephemerocybe angulata TaxID=980116 RepID=A0A8H6HC85_9AGAR|nr:hypothetical protein DFP72DRAFT_1095286 [Tulosesus angulatus]